jgi:hypothetical protein
MLPEEVVEVTPVLALANELVKGGDIDDGFNIKVPERKSRGVSDGLVELEG